MLSSSLNEQVRARIQRARRPRTWPGQISNDTALCQTLRAANGRSRSPHLFLSPLERAVWNRTASECEVRVHSLWGSHCEAGTGPVPRTRILHSACAAINSNAPIRCTKVPQGGFARGKAVHIHVQIDVASSYRRGQDPAIALHERPCGNVTYDRRSPLGNRSSPWQNRSA